MLIAAVAAVALAWPAAAAADPAEGEPLAGYLFVYFTGEGLANGEQVYFALSEGNDPLHWRELNGGQPVLTSDLGTKGLRDPFIIRSPEGDKFFMIATDLRMFGSGDWDGAQRHGSKSIMVWESTDLVNWTDQRLVRVAPDRAGNTWAPEAYYDRQLGEYVVFWASSVFAEDNPNHTGPLPHNRMLYATTSDFRTFSEPHVWYDPGYAVIDSTVIEHDGTFYRYTKDERGRSGSAPCGKFVFADRSTSLLGDYEFIAECIGQGAISQGEGPTVFKSNTEERWYMFIDEFGGRGYVPFTTTDLSTGQWELLPASQYELPSRPRHGTVLPITRSEWIRLQEAYGDECVPEGNCYPDSEPPTTTVALDPAEPGPGGTYEGPVTVTFSADDGALGSGVDRTLYSHNGSALQVYDPAQPLVISEPGFHQIIYRSIDAHGNSEALRQVTFTIAAPPPAGDPALAIAVKPKTKRVKAKRAVALRVSVRNTGESAAGKARVCAKVAKRKAKVAGKSCRKLGALEAGAAAKQLFKVKPTRRAAGKRVKVTFTATAGNAKAARTSAVLRVRK